MKITSGNDNSKFKFVNKNMTTNGYFDGNVNQELNHAVFSLNQVSLNKQGFHLSLCSDACTGLQKWGIYYQAALRSQGQYKDEVYVVDDGMLRKLTVERPVSLSKFSKSFLHYGCNDDGLSFNDKPVIYYQFVPPSSVWDLFVYVYQLFRLNESTFNPFLMVGNDTFVKV